MKTPYQEFTQNWTTNHKNLHCALSTLPCNASKKNSLICQSGTCDAVTGRQQAVERTVVSNVENPPKNRFTQGDFTRFSMQVSENSHNFRFRLPVLHIQNLSNRCRHKYDPPISRFFKNLIFGGLLQFGPTVERGVHYLGPCCRKSCDSSI